MFETKLFKSGNSDVTYEDLLKKIYQKSEYRDSQIEKIVTHIQSVIRSSDDAVILAPTIAKYLETGVKNDDNLVKMAGILSRLIKPGKVADASSDDYTLSEAEKKTIQMELIKETEELLKKP